MEKVRLGFIGAGWWATTTYMPLLAPRADVEMTAVCRLGADLLQTIQDRFGFRYATEDYRELLTHDLDGVIVASPHDLHYEHARAALLRGCHVMCEKPMTLDPAQAWELVALAQQHGVQMLVPYGWHYKSFIQTAKMWLDDGAIGRVEYALCHMASPINYAGDPQGTGAVPAQWAPTLAMPDPSTWYAKEHGGGYGHNQLTHAAALLLWLTGLRAREVTARMSAPSATIDQYIAAAVSFANDSGAEALGTVSGAATLAPDDPFQIDLRIFGSDGVLLLDVERERLSLRRRDGHHRQIEVPAGTGAYSCEGPPARFIDLIHGVGRNDSSGEVAARAVELLEALYRSAERTGAPVAVYR